jgi:hypothetical protein
MQQFGGIALAVAGRNSRRLMGEATSTVATDRHAQKT